MINNNFHFKENSKVIGFDTQKYYNQALKIGQNSDYIIDANPIYRFYPENLNYNVNKQSQLDLMRD